MSVCVRVCLCQGEGDGGSGILHESAITKIHLGVIHAHIHVR